jgi:hypothetical protein
MGSVQRFGKNTTKILPPLPRPSAAPACIDGGEAYQATGHKQADRRQHQVASHVRVKGQKSFFPWLP